MSIPPISSPDQPSPESPKSNALASVLISELLGEKDVRISPEDILDIADTTLPSYWEAAATQPQEDLYEKASRQGFEVSWIPRQDQWIGHVTWNNLEKPEERLQLFVQRTEIPEGLPAYHMSIGEYLVNPRKTIVRAKAQIATSNSRDVTYYCLRTINDRTNGLFLPGNLSPRFYSNPRIPKLYLETLNGLLEKVEPLVF